MVPPVLERAIIKAAPLEILGRYGAAAETFNNDGPVCAECDRAGTMTTKPHIEHGSPLTWCRLTWLVAVQRTSESFLSR